MNRVFTFLAIAASAGCMSSDQLRRREYDENYQRALQQCGRPDATFQQAYNAGYSGERMHSEWIEMCDPSLRAQASTAYQNGFMQGASNAPIRVVHTITPIPGRPMATAPATTTAAASQCTFDSDCGGDGYHCRDHACLGYGGIGDRCVFNEDCAGDHCFGGTCRE
jgi:hypothetical protein